MPTKIYFDSFSYGIGFTIAVSDLLIDIGSIWLFGISKMQLFMIFMNTTLLLAATFPMLSNSDATDILGLIFHSTFGIAFGLYTFLRCYKMISKIVQRIGIVGYSLTYVAFISYELSNHGYLLPLTYSIIMFVAILPFLLTIINYLMFKVIKTIKNNPLHRSSGKQLRLLTLSYVIILFPFFIAMPCVLVSVLGSVKQDKGLISLSIAFLPYVAFFYTISNFLMMSNGMMEDKMEMSGAELLSR